MIALKNITKIYKPKGGEPVKALDDVSVVLPDTGLVFVLGKSGCGKSTLLNIAGGLDLPTSGEIIVKGRSSKSFSQSDFDSYRNTYVGFIFQEYNVLPEFTVAENITLAPELQGDREKAGTLPEILSRVELSGLENRKPLTLSGGQKQRVAIARALIKSPQIILADEPTGALDSATGRSVLDILKQLSQTKLVVVVSHDREFAQRYADRIIELHDGRIISDESFVKDEAEFKDGVAVIGDSVHIIGGLEANMLDRLNELLKEKKKLTVSLEDGSFTASEGHFEPTVQQESEYGTDAPVKLIRSKFPLKYAARMGAAGLKTKRLRLVLTIILSTVALTAFGFMLSLMTFDGDRVLERALEESGGSELAVANYYERIIKVSAVRMEYSISRLEYSDSERIRSLENDTGLDFLKVHTFSGGEVINHSFNFTYNYSTTNEYYPLGFCGFSTADAETLGRFGGTLVAGTMPSDDNSILISTLVAESIYVKGVPGVDGEPLMKSADDYPVGKYISVHSTSGASGALLKICGVFSAPTPGERFEALKDINTTYYSEEDELNDYERIIRLRELGSELNYIYRSSVSTVCFVSEGFYKRHEADFISYDDDYKRHLNYNVANEHGTVDVNFVAFESSSGTEGTALYCDGKKPESSSCLLSPNGVISFIKEICIEGGYVDSALCTELIEAIAGSKGYDDVSEAALYALNKLYGEVPELLEQFTLDTVTGKTVSVCIAGVYKYGDNTDYGVSMYFSAEDIAKLFDIKHYGSDTEGANFLICRNTPEARRIFTSGDIKKRDGEERRFKLYSSYQSNNVESYARIVAVMSDVFFWVGIVVALFASLLLFNFISVSITYKKKDIGILRALGARKIDVFKVFYSESLIIVGICFVLSSVFSVALSMWLNGYLMRNFYVSASLFFFGPLQALVLAALGAIVAFISTFLPVRHNAKKPPVDAIRAL